MAKTQFSIVIQVLAYCKLLQQEIFLGNITYNSFERFFIFMNIKTVDLNRPTLGFQRSVQYFQQGGFSRTTASDYSNKPARFFRESKSFDPIWAVSKGVIDITGSKDKFRSGGCFNKFTGHPDVIDRTEFWVFYNRPLVPDIRPVGLHQMTVQIKVLVAIIPKNKGRCAGIMQHFNSTVEFINL